MEKPSASVTEALEEIGHRAVQCQSCFSGGELKNAFIDIAQPRYIGPRYWNSARRVAFIMLNPGAGTNDWRNQDWQNHLYAYRAGTESLSDVFKAQRTHIPFWGRGKLLSFLKLHGLDVDAVALVNIAWCASEKNKYPRWMLDSCMQRHTGHWLRVIDPKIVILSGVATHGLRSSIEAILPVAEFHQTFHFAHRPLDADKAEARAKEISELLSSSDDRAE